MELEWQENPDEVILHLTRPEASIIASVFARAIINYESSFEPGDSAITLMAQFIHEHGHNRNLLLSKQLSVQELELFARYLRDYNVHGIAHYARFSGELAEQLHDEIASQYGATLPDYIPEQ